MSGALINPRFLMPGAAPGSAQAGWKLYSFVAGTGTPQTTYADASLLVRNPNPLLMDEIGTGKVWLGDLPYAFSLFDTNNVNRGFIDNFTQAGLGVYPAEWQLVPYPAVFVSPTSFSLAAPGLNVVTTYGWTVGTRIKALCSAGYIYCTITAVNTTSLTVKCDSGQLDAGLSSAWYGVIGGSVQSSIQTSSVAVSLVAAQTLASASPTQMNMTSPLVDGLAEISGTFNPKRTVGVSMSTYRFSGEIVLTAAAGTNISSFSGSITVAGQAFITFPFYWWHPNLTAATMILPFDAVVPITNAGSGYVQLTPPAFTGTAMTAWLRNLNIKLIDPTQ